MGRTASTEPQCLYKGDLYLTVELYLYSPYGPYGLYRASVSVQGCTLLFTSTVPLGSTYPPTEGKPRIFLRRRSSRGVKKDLPYSFLDLRLLKTFRPLLVCLNEAMFNP